MTQRPHCSHYALIICCDSRSSILANNKHPAGPSALPAWVIPRVTEIAMEKRERRKMYHTICGNHKDKRDLGGRKLMGSGMEEIYTNYNLM